MPQKQATFITYGPDERCDDIRKFIEGAGVKVILRDLGQRPLTVEELDMMFGHNPMSYFINPASSEYTKLGLDKKMPERRELFQLISQNPGLLRRPIVCNARLLTVGCNKDKIAEMLQINANGEPMEETNEHKNEHRNEHRSNHKVPRRSLPARR
jgi:regulatory protein spx